MSGDACDLRSFAAEGPYTAGFQEGGCPGCRRTRCYCGSFSETARGDSRGPFRLKIEGRGNGTSTAPVRQLEKR